MKTIVLIPAYHPEQKMVPFVNSLVKNGLDVMVVDDGSGKEYKYIFEELNSKVKVISYDVNRGKGYALKQGYAYIDKLYHDYVILTADADGQHSLEDIKKLVRIYESNRGSLLLGVREFTTGDIPFRSKFGNELTKKIMSLVTKKDISDTQTGLRAFDDSLTKMMLMIDGDRFEYETKVLLECSKEGINIVEEKIKTIYEGNNEGSHFNPIKDSWAIYKEIIKFASVSILSFLIDLIMYVILLSVISGLSAVLNVSLANIGARLISGSFNFYANRNYTFKSNSDLLKSVMSYIMLAITILIGNTILLNLLVNGLGLNAIVGKIITEITFFIFSYLIQKKFIFRREQINYEQKSSYNN